MDKSEVDSYIRAGKIAREVKVFARSLIEPGMKLIDIAEGIDAKILELGGKFAFPVNLSLNEIAAHFTPVVGDEDVAEGILKIDIGVAIDGFIADCAFSVDLTKNNEFSEMIGLNEKILSKVSDVIFSREGDDDISVVDDEDGLRVCDVGKTVQDVMEESGGNFSVIRSLSGHALGKNAIHAGLTISNYRNDNRTKLDDMAFAIEPFVTSGVGDIFEGKGGGIYILKGDGRVRDRDARRVLEFVREEYGARPFCLRWLAKFGGSDVGGRMSVNKIRFVLRTLVKQGILYEYPMLIEKSRKPVSQFENTFLIADGKVVCTTG